jgi:hypothetical protein
MLMNWHSHEEGPGEHRRGGGEERGEGREHRRGEHEGDDRGEGRGPGRRGPRGGGRGFGRPGGWQNVDVPPADDAQAWFEGRLPGDWFTDVTVTVDREEITVVGKLADEELSSESGTEPAAAEGRISRFRAESRPTRIQIAEEAEARYRRKVSWGAELGEVQSLFTHISVPVMTRLRQPERQVLDTLVDAGVARSRSEALAWAVKLTGEHADSWLANLRQAMSEVDKLRSEGPEF